MRTKEPAAIPEATGTVPNHYAIARIMTAPPAPHIGIPVQGTSVLRLVPFFNISGGLFDQIFF